MIKSQKHPTYKSRKIIVRGNLSMTMNEKK